MFQRETLLITFIVKKTKTNINIIMHAQMIIKWIVVDFERNQKKYFTIIFCKLWTAECRQSFKTYSESK